MKIKLNESKTLEFNVDTKGCTLKDLKGHLRFTFEGIEYGFPAKFEDESIKVEVPAFQKILSNRLTESISSHKEVTVKARMDIIANNDTYISPWKGDIDIEIPVSIQVKEEKKTPRPPEKVSISDPDISEAFDDLFKKDKKSKLKDMLEVDIKPKKKEEKVDELTTPQKHQLKIAKSTLKMSDAGANIMGGMSKEEAREFLKSIGWNDKKIKKLEEEKEPEEVKKSRFAQSLEEAYVKKGD